MILTLEDQTLICPTERVIGAKGLLQSESLQRDQMEVQDHPKQTARSLKPRLHHPCQVGRHWWTAPKHLSLETYKILSMFIRDKNRLVRSPLQNHDRMDSGRRYCLLATIHEATCQGCRALSTPMWNPASITDMMSDNLDITEAVVLEHITAILYVGQWSAGERLTEEEAQACIDHFRPYIKWRGVAVKHEFQALMLAEAQET